MPSTFTDTKIDIYEFPDRNIPLQGDLTIGDLHGNALKFINALLTHGIIKFKDNAAQIDNYKILAQIYTRLGTLVEQIINDQDNEDLKNEITLLHRSFQNIFAELECIDNKKLIRLLGDVFADRGSSSALMLMIYELAFKSNLEITTIMSDHDLEFISAYYNLKQNNIFENPYPVIDNTHKVSIFGISTLLETNQISKEALIDIVEECYIPTLKLIDYTLTQDGGIRIFTHAPVKFNIIRYMAEKLKISYNDETPFHLADVITKINAEFQERLKEGRIGELFPELLENGKLLFPSALNDTQNTENQPVLQRLFPKLYQDRLIKKFPFWYLIWNRFTPDLDNIEQRPNEYKGYVIYYAHGHDPYQSKFRFVTNLDSMGGKISQNSQSDMLEKYNQKLRNEQEALEKITEKFNNTNNESKKLKLKKQMLRLERSITQGTYFINTGFFESLKEYKFLDSTEKGLRNENKFKNDYLALRNYSWRQDFTSITRTAAISFSLTFMLGLSVRESGLFPAATQATGTIENIVRGAYFGGVTSLITATASLTSSFRRRFISYISNRNNINDLLLKDSNIPIIEAVPKNNSNDDDEEIDDRFEWRNTRNSHTETQSNPSTWGMFSPTNNSQSKEEPTLETHAEIKMPANMSKYIS